MKQKTAGTKGNTFFYTSPKQSSGINLHGINLQESTFLLQLRPQDKAVIRVLPGHSNAIIQLKSLSINKKFGR